MSTDSSSFTEHLQSMARYWAAFYKKIDELVAIDYPEPPRNTDEPFDYEQFKVEVKLHDARRLATIKKYISATHTWIPGKLRWVKRLDNALQSPLECSVCRLGASKREEIDHDYRLIDFENGELPSRDMHGHFIHRTCQDVLDARAAYRKKRRGRKCYQCSTYGCIHD